jgi:hypothetical protein
MNPAATIRNDYFAPAGQARRLRTADWRLHRIDFIYGIGYAVGFTWLYLNSSRSGVRPDPFVMPFLGIGLVMFYLTGRVLGGDTAGATAIFAWNRPLARRVVWTTRLRMLLGWALLLDAAIILTAAAIWQSEGGWERGGPALFCLTLPPLAVVGAAWVVVDRRWPRLLLQVAVGFALVYLAGLVNAMESGLKSDDPLILFWRAWPLLGRQGTAAAVMALAGLLIYRHARRRWMNAQIGEVS